MYFTMAWNNFNRILFLVCVYLLHNTCCLEYDESTSEQLDFSKKFRLDGKVTVPSNTAKEWATLAKVLVDGGQYLGLVKPDGSFSVSNIPSGSYVVEVNHPTYVFDPIRVEINSKGKVRARSLNHIQPSSVQTVGYPLKMKARGQAQYFEKREQWRVTDVLLNPMIMMMVLPLGLMLVLPKLMNSQDPEVQKEMQQMSMLQPQQNLPDPSELLTKWFGGGNNSAKKKEIKNKGPKKQQ